MIRTEGEVTEGCVEGTGLGRADGWDRFEMVMLGNE